MSIADEIIAARNLNAHGVHEKQLAHTGDERLGAKLRLARMTIGLTQQEVADELNLPRSGVSAWESGRGMPTVPALVKAAALYQCNLLELVEHFLETR